MLNRPLNAVLTRLAIVAVVLATMMLLASGASAQTLNPTQVMYDENDTKAVGVYRASDPQGRTIVWSVKSTGDEDFKIGKDSGVLEFMSPPDYEEPKGGEKNKKNTYMVEVRAIGITLKTVTVTVKDVDEDGTIKLSSQQPEVGADLKASDLADVDEDDDVNNKDTLPEYEWAASSNGTSGWADIDHATALIYRPVVGDVDKYLRITAEYGAAGNRKTASVVSANAVQTQSNVNTVPVFPDQNPAVPGSQTPQTRDLREDAEEGDPVGAPVVASDDRGALTYTFNVDKDNKFKDDEASFTIDPGSGQIKVGEDAEIDFETADKDKFTVTVTATDGAGAPSDPAVTVTIEVTDVNEAPKVTSASYIGTIKENELKNLIVGKVFSATDEDNIPSGSKSSEKTTWSVSDTSLFKITTGGQISFVSSPDFEAHATINKDGLDAMLKVMAVATDERGMTGMAELTVTVTNMQEDGTVTMSTQQPQAGIAVTASLTDPDGGPVTDGVQRSLAPTWKWDHGELGKTGTCPDVTKPGAWVNISDADEATYTPVTTDVGMCLLATARYDDGRDKGESAAGVSANRVLKARTSNRAPEFKGTDDEGTTVTITSAERTIDENSVAGDPVGDSVPAIDADAGDNPTYSRGGADAASFDIDPGSGQISVSDTADLDYETKATYRVTVTATDGNRARTSIPVTINVKDLNERPTVSGPDEVDGYAENGTGDVGAYTATDQDRNVDHDRDDSTPTLARDTVKWSKSGIDAGEFDISDSGVLSFMSPPDFDAPADSGMDNEYKVTVTATDSAGNPGTKDVTVTVTDLEEPGTVTLSAEQPGVGIVLMASVMDEDDADNSAAADWQWSISDSADGAFADIANRTDPSYTPVANDAGKYLRATATYGAEDAMRSSSETSANPVKAYDNVNAAPVFPDQEPDSDGPQTEQKREIPENSAKGTAVGDPVTATDSNEIDVLTYTIDDVDVKTPQFTALTIDQATGQISVGDTAELDYETKKTYMVVVTATDGSGASASAKVTITVTDVNEAPVIVDATGTEGTAAENATKIDGLIPSAFSATDQEKDTITWSVEGADGAAFSVTVDAINLDKATLAFKSAPDYEAKASAAGDNVYKVTVVAADDAGNRDTLTVTVMVTNVNEAGSITFSTLQPQAGVAMSATLTDPDGIKGEVTWTSTNTKEKESLNGVTLGKAATISFTPTNGGKLKLNAAYDDNQSDSQSVIDIGTRHPALASKATNTAPKFADDQDPETKGDQAVAARDISERAPVGATVGAPVKATDTDTYHDETLTYSLSGPDAESFRIVRGNDVKLMLNDGTKVTGTNGGQIVVADGTKLDFESDKKTYMVVVTATDGSGASDSVNVTINVTDFEEPPMLSQAVLVSGETDVDYAENGTEPVATYTASKTSGVEEIAWSLSGGDAGDFDIDDDGVLSFATSPNFDAPADSDGDNEYNVTVTAADAEDDAVNDSRNVTVTVTDVNEAPVFDTETAERSVAENSEAGAAVGDPVAATEEDEGDTLTYTLDGDDADSFTIDAATGQISVGEGTALDFESDTTSYSVTVSVSDGKNADGADDAAIDDTVMVTIMVTNVNETPMFEADTAERSVAENTAAGTPVGDPVTALEGTSYSLSESGYFEIDEMSGQISTTMVLDYEEMTSHSVTVTATGAIDETDTIDVTIMVTDMYPDCTVAGNNGLTNDCEALLDSEADLGGSLNWGDAGIAMADWHGVTVDGIDGMLMRVTRLDLRAKDTGGRIPAALGRLEMLTYLNLRNNDLTGGIPAELNNLGYLTYLGLHNNMLSGDIPDLDGLTMLEELYLSGKDMALTGGVPAWLNDMTNLRELWLWGNDLGDEIPDLSGMSSIVRIKLQSTGLTGGLKATFNANLVSLNLSGNPLGGGIPDLSGLTGLGTLWVHSSGLTGSIHESVGMLPNLRRLNLRNNMLDGEIPDLGGLDNLTHLRLQRNMLNGSIPASLGGLDSLQELWLFGNMLSGTIPSELGDLADTLRKIGLKENNFDADACVPTALANVATNDYFAAGLTACRAGDGS